MEQQSYFPLEIPGNSEIDSSRGFCEGAEGTGGHEESEHGCSGASGQKHGLRNKEDGELREGLFSHN